MAIIKFVSTSIDKLNDIPISMGQVIFVQDQRTVYLDTDVRTSYQQIITLQTDLQRRALPHPLRGFYFILETCVLWYYDGEWHPVNSPPTERLFFVHYDEFPEIGNEQSLYIDGENIYRFMNGNYKLLTGSLSWGQF